VLPKWWKVDAQGLLDERALATGGAPSGLARRMTAGSARVVVVAAVDHVLRSLLNARQPVLQLLRGHVILRGAPSRLDQHLG